MARALGFHLRGEKVNYALVDRDPEEGIVVLAAGETTTEAVNFLYQKLSGGRPLPWAVARFKEGNPSLNCLSLGLWAAPLRKLCCNLPPPQPGGSLKMVV